MPEKMGWKSCPEEKVLSQISMLSGTGEMIDVIGDDISHYEGEEDVKLTKVIMIHREIPSGWLVVIGLRNAPHLGTFDGNILYNDISHFKPVHGASLPDFMCSLTVMAHNSRYSLSVPFSSLVKKHSELRHSLGFQAEHKCSNFFWGGYSLRETCLHWDHKEIFLQLALT